MMYLSYSPEAGIAWAQLDEFERDELMRNMRSMISSFARRYNEPLSAGPCRKFRVDGLKSAMNIDFHIGDDNSIELVITDVLT